MPPIRPKETNLSSATEYGTSCGVRGRSPQLANFGREASKFQQSNPNQDLTRLVMLQAKESFLLLSGYKVSAMVCFLICKLCVCASFLIIDPYAGELFPTGDYKIEFLFEPTRAHLFVSFFKESSLHAYQNYPL